MMKRINNFTNHTSKKMMLIILVIVALKIVLMGIFSSDYQNIMFIEFINSFLNNFSISEFINPYNYTFTDMNLFPYPPFMLFVESIGGVFSAFFGNVLFLKNIFFKLPNLFFDLLGFYYLLKIFPTHSRKITVLYFASPIIVYSTYMHGQLDIIPTTLLIGSLYYLVEKKNLSLSAIFLGFSLSSKFHILAIIPILVLFIIKRYDLKIAIRYVSITIGLTILICLPFFGSGFINYVIWNEEMGILTKIYIQLNDLRVFIPIVFTVLIYLKFFTIKRINKELLYSVCGIVFIVFLVTTPPMPGWYVWIIPFITIFFVNTKIDQLYSYMIYVCFHILYLLYFIFAHKTAYVDLYYFTNSLQYLKIDSPLFVNLIFSLLVTVLLYITYLMYQYGVTSNTFYQRKFQSFTIGISGDSGSGKSTLLNMFTTILGNKNLLLIEGDGDHKWERNNSMWEFFTHLNPKANYLYRQANDLALLKQGQKVVRSDYDHSSGTFTDGKFIRTKPYIILCGLHSLYLPQIRPNLDLKIYMDIDENLRRYWKIQRDITKRGHSLSDVRTQIDRRMDDAVKYIYPQRKYADILIKYFDPNLLEPENIDYDICISVKLTLEIAINIEPIVEVADTYGILVNYDYNEDLQTQSIVFGGDKLHELTISLNETADMLIPQLDEITIEPLENMESNLECLLSLMLLTLISYKMSNGDKK